MSIWKDLQKLFNERFLILLGIVVLVIAVGMYSSNKGLVNDSMAGGRQNTSFEHAEQNAENVINAIQADNNVQASNALGQNGGYAAINSAAGAPNTGLPSSCSKQSVNDPASLLPNSSNNEWGKLNPQGNGDLNNMNFLKAGYHMGVNTVGQSLRNANLQLRSEPANPQLNVGPWNNTTMQPDVMRVPLEIGQGPA